MNSSNMLKRVREYKEVEIMLKLIKIGAGEYITEDGTITVGKDDGYWYAADVKTSQSVVDSQRTLKAIKELLEWYLSRR